MVEINQILRPTFYTHDVACETITLQQATNPLGLGSHDSQRRLL